MSGAVLPPGSIVGKDYRIHQRLAAGGMGVVYEATQISTGKKRAIKVMHAQYETDERARQRFIQEARAGASIDSDHIVEMVGAGIDDETGTPWIAMELLIGKDLKKVLSERKVLPPGEVLEIFRQLCHALGAAHAMGLVHRDLKPENIFLANARREGVPFTVKLLDFGIAKLVLESHTSSSQTQAVGSPRWMAPEQAERGGAISASTDVWALGLIAFNLLTGRIYWKTANSENPSVIQQITEVLMEPIAPPSKRADEYGCAAALPDGFDEWFLHCVNRKIADRYQNANDAIAALEPVLQGAGAGAVPAPVRKTQTSAAHAARSGGNTVPGVPSAMRTGGHTAARGRVTAVELDAPLPPDSVSREHVPREEPAPSSKGGFWLVMIVGAAILGTAGALLVPRWMHPTRPTTRPAPADVARVAAPVLDAGSPAVTPPSTPPDAAPDAGSEPTIAPLTLVDASTVAALHTDAGATTPRRHGRDRAAREGDAGAAAPYTEQSSQQYSESVVRALRGRNTAFADCYERHGQGSQEAHVILYITLNPDGRPSNTDVRGVSSMPAVASCIEAIVRGMTFPTPVVSPGPIVYSMRFERTVEEPSTPAPSAPTTPPAAP